MLAPEVGAALRTGFPADNKEFMCQGFSKCGLPVADQLPVWWGEVPQKTKLRNKIDMELWFSGENLTREGTFQQGEGVEIWGRSFWLREHQCKGPEAEAHPAVSEPRQEDGRGRGRGGGAAWAPDHAWATMRQRTAALQPPLPTPNHSAGHGGQVEAGGPERGLLGSSRQAMVPAPSRAAEGMVRNGWTLDAS